MTDEQNKNTVVWQAAKVYAVGETQPPVNAWQLSINGRVVLTAVAMSEITEAVSKPDRALIGRALSEYLSNHT